MPIPYIYSWFNGMGNQLLTMINAIHFTFYFNKFENIELPKNACFVTKNFPENNNDNNDNVSQEEKDKKIDITRRINPCSDWFCLGVKEMKNIYSLVDLVPFLAYKLICQNVSRTFLILLIGLHMNYPR